MSYFFRNILFIVFCENWIIVPGFKVYWNVPSHQCRIHYGTDLPPLLRDYGIFVNNGDKFQGEAITIFYDRQLGLYPKILKSGEFENGGLPQLGNLTKHLEQTASDIKKIIPNKSFKGLGVIDWEAWRPTWQFNWGSLHIYRMKSEELTKEKNSTKDDKEIHQLTMEQWETSARYYMLETLQLAMKMRPLGRWCYYLFPDCYNYEGQTPTDFQCSEATRKGNDRLSWLWEASTAICPSIYVYPSHLNKYSFEQRLWKDGGKLEEAIRVASAKARIYVYINYYLETETVPQDELWRMLAQVAAAGADGAVIWGASSGVSTQEQCQELKNYITDVLGPAAENVARKSNMCSKEICNNRGKCRWPKDVQVAAWKLFKDQTTSSFYAGDIVCRCSLGYSGRFCQIEE